MNETNIIADIEKVEELIENDDYIEALKIIKSLPEGTSSSGRIAYDLGIIAVKTDDRDMALKFFDKAEENGFINADLLYQKIKLLIDYGETDGVEDLFERIKEYIVDPDEMWAVYNEQIRYYLDNDLLLNADKMAKDMIKSFPDNYHGFHYHFVVEMEKEHYNEAKSCLDVASEKFSYNREYLLDLAEYHKATDEDKLYELLKNDKRFMEYIPDYCLKNIYHFAKEKNDTKEMIESLKQLAFDYHDSDGILSILMLLQANNSYEDAVEVANLLMKINEKEMNVYYLFGLYYQMFNYYSIYKGNLSESMKNWIIDAGNVCIDFSEAFGEEISKTVIENVNFLFDQLKN